MRLPRHLLRQFSELDINRIGAWPRLPKLVVVSAVNVLVFVLAYGLFIRPLIADQHAERDQQVELKNQFAAKYSMTKRMSAYEVQLIELTRLADNQLKQLPNQDQIASLLDDVSFMATHNGLTLHRINWEKEVPYPLFTELPMSLEVVGSYHELGQFVAALAALPRIVLVDNLSLRQEPTGQERIVMTLQAKTYKYKGKDKS